jgi:hypothetical protein
MAPDPAEIPSVLVRHHPDAGARALREVCAGAEEEGVPTRVLVADAGACVVSEVPEAPVLAHCAALDSRLDVGIGLDGRGQVSVHHAKLPEGSPVRTLPAGAGPADWRWAGRTAARIVKGLPL